jgi:hypothetical protein
MPRLQASPLSHTEEASLKRLAAGAPHSSIPSDHLARLRKLMLVERHGSTWRLTPLGLQRLQGMPKAVQITSVDPLALLESIVTKQHALREHRGLVRERKPPRSSNNTNPRTDQSEN